MGKLTHTAAAAVGYVLGARAGRERYEQIAAGARRVWRDPRVQKASSQAQGKTAQKVRETAPMVKEAVKDKVSDAAHRVRRDSGDSGGSDDSGGSGDSGYAGAPTSTTTVTPPVSADQPATTPPGTSPLAGGDPADERIGGPA